MPVLDRLSIFNNLPTCLFEVSITHMVNNIVQRLDTETHNVLYINLGSLNSYVSKTESFPGGYLSNQY